MRRTILAVSMAAAALLAASPARAQAKSELGEKGQFILSADRLLSLFSYQSFKTSPDDNNSSTESTTGFSLLTSNSSHRTVFDAPRAALDYTIINRLTIGGSVFVAFDVSHDVTTKTNGTSVSTDQAKGTFWGFAPRVGYILPISNSVAFWPRGGLSYIRGTSTNPSNNNADSSVTLEQLALDLEPIFVISPVPHFGITIGPVIDIPITGNYKSENTINNVTRNTSIDAAQFYIGASAGLLGYF